MKKTREQEREEQQRIRERMQDEKKAQQEYEKEQKATEKAEEKLNKKLEKINSEYEALKEIKEADRLKYQNEIEELKSQLQELEIHKQKVLSMAQQTKHGNVYVISNIGSFGEDVYKVGLTRRLNPMDRISELSNASVPFGFDVHAFIESDDAPALEAELHRALENNRVNRVNTRKEFFKAPLEVIKDVVENKGLKVNWTMTAPAFEYRQSLKFEEIQNRKGIEINS